MTPRCWWEVETPAISVSTLAQTIALALEQGQGYRADRGAVPLPTDADLIDYELLQDALDARVAAGRAYVEAHPDETRYRRIVRLLQVDADATFATWLDALHRYEQRCDSLAQVTTERGAAWT